MVMCTICGTIWNDQDMFEGKEHKCKEEDIPQRNESFRFNRNHYCPCHLCYKKRMGSRTTQFYWFHAIFKKETITV